MLSRKGDRTIKLKRARQIVQILAILLFFFLIIQTEYRGTNQLQYPVRIFLDFDPLILVSTLLSARGIPTGLPAAMGLSLVLVAVTALMGRVFCGWVCPFGIINHFVGWLKRKRKAKKKDFLEKDRYSAWQKWKYWLLTGLLVASLFSVQVTGIFDPLSLVIRSFAVAVNPAINFMLRAFFDAVYFLGIDFLTGITEPVYDLLKDSYLSFNQPHFSYTVLIGLIFVGILLLNLIRFRFWCRYICPLGALLGVIGRRSALQLKVSDKCTGCNNCVTQCPAAAEPQAKKGGKDHDWRPSECIYCWNCVAECPTNALSFKWTLPFKRAKTTGVDLSRREFVASSVAGLLAVPVLRTGTRYKDHYADPSLIRPPGSLIEKEFLQRCVRCGECMKVCLTNVIQPVFTEAGLEAMFTPKLDMKAGYCEYNCTLCGQVCPTGAIRELREEERSEIKIGTAFIDKNRCIPYQMGNDCIVCEEHCPTPEKAIWFEYKEMLNDYGERKVIKLPRVNMKNCIGCGICENKCPVVDIPAIRVTSVGETRDPNHQMLLEVSASDSYY
ncbi:MAG: 4Fe-4S binding protein [Acidobacteria bacterium]|nr:4Fe-4S binding protein [Acidobacteriota bacterium]